MPLWSPHVASGSTQEGQRGFAAAQEELDCGPGLQTGPALLGHLFTCVKATAGLDGLPLGTLPTPTAPGEQGLAGAGAGTGGLEGLEASRALLQRASPPRSSGPGPTSHRGRRPRGVLEVAGLRALHGSPLPQAPVSRDTALPPVIHQVSTQGKLRKPGRLEGSAGAAITWARAGSRPRRQEGSCHQLQPATAGVWACGVAQAPWHPQPPRFPPAQEAAASCHLVT